MESNVRRFLRPPQCEDDDEEESSSDDDDDDDSDEEEKPQASVVPSSLARGKQLKASEPEPKNEDADPTNRNNNKEEEEGEEENNKEDLAPATTTIPTLDQASLFRSVERLLKGIDNDHLSQVTFKTILQQLQNEYQLDDKLPKALKAAVKKHLTQLLQQRSHSKDKNKNEEDDERTGSNAQGSMSDEGDDLFVDSDDDDEPHDRFADPDDDDEPPPIENPLLRLLTEPDVTSIAVGSHILGFLRHRQDIQHLLASFPSLKHHIPKLHATTLDWLRDVEILFLLKSCKKLRKDDNTEDMQLFQKVAQSLLLHPHRARVLDKDGFGQEPCSLYQGYGEILARFPNTEGINFVRMYPDYFDSLSCQDYYINAETQDDFLEQHETKEQVEDKKSGSTDNTVSATKSNKRQRLLECSSCSVPITRGTEGEDGYVDGTGRLFVMENYDTTSTGKQSYYCGDCLEDDFFLKLQFCLQHVTELDAPWGLEEPSYEVLEECDDEKPWGLQPDEFWVKMFYMKLYDEEEWRFVGVGPRKE